jgi:hypothetical protein
MLVFSPARFRNILAIPAILCYILFIDSNIRKLGWRWLRGSQSDAFGKSRWIQCDRDTGIKTVLVAQSRNKAAGFRKEEAQKLQLRS